MSWKAMRHADESETLLIIDDDYAMDVAEWEPELKKWLTSSHTVLRNPLVFWSETPGFPGFDEIKDIIEKDRP